MEISKTLCKQCERCETFTYSRTLKRGKRKGELFKVIYCQGNKDIIEKYNLGPQCTGSDYEYVAGYNKISKKYKFIPSIFRKYKKTYINYLNKDRHDLRLKNLHEVTHTCHVQGYEKIGMDSIYPGVKLEQTGKNPKWESRGKIDGKIKYFGLCNTEEEAAHKYYTTLKKRGIMVNTQTEAYKRYQDWLNTVTLIDDPKQEFKERKCICGNYFVPRVRKQVYCSKKCKIKAANDRNNLKRNLKI
ncbi:hypothetical protein [Methanobacterium paludis]|uniref:Uncharacterized protein n=1 Tax=Methanobacterium paludis (strain DSM 25820 / JCM 18151 / SWAN1) TaxID=868131 RepID=F6D2T2_METPW|nr:hypothetical protein [Methanobacterium paludis]AEG18661.1 hypothetical protein MSWAN_1650 [Methanobacterium paludis]